MLQNLCKTLGFKKNMVYEIPPGGGKPYPASGLLIEAGHTPFETGPDSHVCDVSFPKICSAVSPIRWVVIILFGVMSWAL